MIDVKKLRADLEDWTWLTWGGVHTYSRSVVRMSPPLMGAPIHLSSFFGQPAHWLPAFGTDPSEPIFDLSYFATMEGNGA